MTFPNIHQLERQGTDIQSKDQSLRNRYVIFEIEDKEDLKMLDGLKVGDTITQIQGVTREK